MKKRYNIQPATNTFYLDDLNKEDEIETVVQLHVNKGIQTIESIP